LNFFTALYVLRNTHVFSQNVREVFSMAINSCLTFIRRHISFLKKDEIFTTRDCLVYGKRSSVDNALCALVNAGTIKRITRGVFVRPSKDFVWPSAEEVAIIKASAFGKKLLIHGADTASKHGLLPQGNEMPTYYVDGSSSRFRYRGQYINLRKASRKRMQLADDNAGLAIRALWHLGEQNVGRKEILQVAFLWNTRVEREKIYRGKAWMPAWLGDFFLTNEYMGPFGPGRSIPAAA
jgi:hypothetical protein